MGMKATWWFKDNFIAGMARPGFNASRWSDLSADEGILFGWLGQFSSGPAPIESFHLHLQHYAPKVFPFFKLGKEAGTLAMRVFDDPTGTLRVLHRLADRTKAFKEISIDLNHVYFSVNEERVKWEMEYLKKIGVRRIVSLTEQHHNKELLAEHFGLHHFSIEDLNAPRKEQVLEFTEVIKKSKQDREIVAVHCLAGIGRTSTMLMAAHLAIGESYEELKSLLAERNPTFKLVGPQKEFIRSLQK